MAYLDSHKIFEKKLIRIFGNPFNEGGESRMFNFSSMCSGKKAGFILSLVGILATAAGSIASKVGDCQSRPKPSEEFKEFKTALEGTKENK